MVDAGFHTVALTFDDLYHEADEIGQIATDAWNETSHIIESDIPTAFDRAVATAARWVATVERLARSVYHDALDYTDELRHDAARWLDDLRHDTATGFDRIRHDTASALDRVRHDAAADIDAARHDALHDLDVFRSDIVEPIERFVWGDVRDLWYVARKAWGWLLWFADHPFTRIEDALKSIEHDFSLSAIEADLVGASDFADHLAETLAKWIS